MDKIFKVISNDSFILISVPKHPAKNLIKGHSSAQYYIGFMYEGGQGVIQDDTRAYMWFDIAASNRSDKGREKRDIIAKKMTLVEISKAQDMALDCMSSNYKECGF